MMFIEELLKPWCAVCDKPVERLRWCNDVRRNIVIATVYCHGERESCELNEQQVVAHNIEPGLAFKTKRVE